MSGRRRRLIGVLAALAVLVAVAASQRRQEPPLSSFRVTLGLKDRESSDWSGQVEVAEGDVAALTGWRFEGKDAVQGLSGWKCRTHDYIEPGARYPLDPAKGKPPSPPEEPWPNGINLGVRGNHPTVTLTLKAGVVRFRADQVRLGEPREFLGGQVRVERQPLTTLLRPAAPPRAVEPVQDDYPAFWVRYRTGKQYLAWAAYQKGKDRILLVEREGPEGSWSQPVEVAGPGDHFRVALAGTHGGVLWVVWASQRQGAWNLYGRPYRDGRVGEEMRLTEGAGPNLWHVMTTDQRGRAWLVWQGCRNGQFEIFARCADADGWHDTISVSDSQARGNKWNPAVTADYKEDRVWVGWDSYETGAYNIQVRSLSGGPAPRTGSILLPEKSGAFQAHPSLACDRAGRLWVAWDQSGPAWGKDYGFLYPRRGGTRLYQDRTVRIACFVDTKWREPPGELAGVLARDLGGKEPFNELPHLQDDGQGRMWLAYRHRTCRHPRVDGWSTQGRWDVYATAWLGDRWTTPVELPHSGGRNDMRVTSQRDREGRVYFAHASDNRGWRPPNMAARNLSVAVSRLDGALLPRTSPEPSFRPPRPARVPEPDPAPEQKDVARVRGYKVEVGGRTYRIYRGDMHRHTDISWDGVGDGSLLDLHRYALDAAGLDFVLVTDHNMGNDQEYPWWRTQKANDLYSLPGRFLSMYGYERSVPYPNGHRNVIWTERGHRTLPLPQRALRKQMAEDTSRLYAYLRRTGGICTSHTSATDQGTNWEQEIDPTLEPVVELFQGYYASSEAPGAPRAANDRMAQVHGPFRPDGFVVRALDRGYRLGFQASSDHISTHVSFACLLAEEFSRQGLVDALRRRHAYAATDNIVLDVRVGARGMMGDEVRMANPALDVVVLGTGAIDRVEVLRNGAVVHTVRPGKAETRFRWEDPAPRKGEKPSYYYVRVVQTNGEMAWASPVWVTVGS